MSEKLTVGELVYKISGDMDNLKAEVKRADAEIGKLKKSMDSTAKKTQGMSSAFTAAKVAVSGFITGALARGLYTIIQSGAELDALSQSFSKLAGQAGLGTEEVLTSLKNLSGGTISNKDLILSANRALTLGVATSMEEFNTLMQTARIRAQDMGLSTTQAFDNIVTGIGRGSPLILDNLGFIVSATQAQEAYAKKLGVTADKLTEAQKKEALKASVLNQGRAEIERVGAATATYADRLAQASTFVTNLKDNIGRALLPAMASLLDSTLENGQSMDLTADQVNNLGKIFYRLGQVLIVVGKGITVGFRLIVGTVQTFVLKTAESIQRVLEIADKATTALGLNSEALSSGLELTNNFIASLQGKMADNLESIEESSYGVKDALSEALDPQKYQGLSNGELAALITKTSDATAGVGDSAEEAKEKVEDFTDKLISLRDEAVKTGDELTAKLGESFKEFGDSIKDNFDESVTSLAQVVIAAEQAKKDIKESLKADDLSDDSRSDLKKQLKEQEAILKSRKDFEERQAETIAGIRLKLEEAGIDAAKAGLDGLLEVRSLEAQLEEDRRIASLDEFVRLEEEQNRKLTAMVDAFITETKLLEEKIAKQKEYEIEITDFLINEDEKRLANTEAWATATLAEHGKLAASLRSLISQQSLLNSLRDGSVGTSSRPTPVSTRTTNNSTTTNNSRTVNAPVNINANVGSGVDLRTLGNQIAWELGNK